MGRHLPVRRWLQILLWVAALLAVAPRFSLYFYEHLWDAEFAFFARPSLFAFSYLLISVLVIAAFALRCRQPRAVLWATALVLVVLQIGFAAIGWGRLALFMALPVAATLAVEIVRQNRPLFVQLCRQGTRLTPVVLRSLLLWSPLALVALAGLKLNGAVSDSVDRMFYTSTPIDRFCEASTASRQWVLPCTGLAVGQMRAQQREIDFDPALTRYVGERFLGASRSLIGQVDDATEVAPTVVQALQAELDPAAILGLAGEPLLAEALIAADAQARRLGAQIESAEARLLALRPPPPIGTSAFHLLPVAQLLTDIHDRRRSGLEARVRTLEQRLGERMQVVLAAAEDTEAETRAQVASVRHRLRRMLGKAQLAGRMPPADAPRATWTAYLIRSLDAMERASLELLEEGLRGFDDPAVARAALAMDRLCTLEGTAQQVLDQQGASTVMNQGLFRCLPAAGTVRVRPLGLKHSTDLSIDRWRLQQELAGNRKLREIARAGYRRADEVGEAIKDSGGIVPSRIDLGRKKCDLLRLGNCATNYAKSKAEGAYADVHRSGSAQGAQRVDAGTDRSAQTADAAIMRLRGKLYAGLDASARYMKASVAGIDQLGSLLSVALAVLFAIAVVKSLMFVLATRLFDAAGAATIALGQSDGDGEHDGKPPQGSYEAGSAITIPKSFTEPLITRVTLDNQDNSKVLAPWPLAAPVTRILHNAYFLFTRGSHFSHGDQPMHFSRASGQHIIKWNLEPGEEVVFRYRHFFGASANVRLKRTFSLRLSTILLGRLVFHSAQCTQGAGCLLLTVRGTVTDHRQTDSTPLERLIAWNRHTRFRVASRGTLKSVFIDGYTVMRERDGDEPSGLIVVEAIGDERNMFSGAAHFFKALFLPF